MKTETNLAAKIEKILKVVDTRDFEEQGDRWVAIPGSGVENTCARCGRAHEIHATVLLSDKSEAIVGVSCMKGDSLELAGQVRRGAGRATRLAKAKSEAAILEANLESARAILASTRAAFVPEFKLETRERSASNGGTFQVLTCGGSLRFLLTLVDGPELRWALVEQEIARLANEALRAQGLLSTESASWRLADAKDRIAKLEAAAAAEVAS